MKKVTLPVFLAVTVSNAQAQVKVTKDQMMFYTSDGTLIHSILETESPHIRIPGLIRGGIRVDAHPEKLKMPRAEFEALLAKSKQSGF